MKLYPLPALTDNYIWLLQSGPHALVVDPGDAEPVLDYLHTHGVQLQGILITHHHPDHTAGVPILRERTGAPVFGPATEIMPEPLTRVSGSHHVALLGLQWRVMDIPGHTAGHIAYFCDDVAGEPLVFCGDTLFSAGCGRLFEGTAQQMLTSLQTLSALPDNTQVCCTHEYTLSNLKFARKVDPDNTALQSHELRCQNLRAQGLPTLPSRISTERAINPFLRSTSASVVASVTQYDAAGVKSDGVFATLRRWKNQAS
jgi:hydroxyacylglutathione hydrolase